MKVLQLGKYFPPDLGGMETHVRDLCEGLAKRHDVTCVVAEGPRSRGLAREKKGALEVLRFKTITDLLAPVSLDLLRHVKRRAKDFDVVHLHMPNPCAELACLRARPRRLVVTYHADVVDKPGAALYRRLQERVLRRADRIIVSSDWYAMTSRVLRAFRGKCVSVPHGFERARLRGRSRQIESVLAGLAGPRFLFVGRLVAYKGLRYLVEAMKQVEGTLCIVGEGPMELSLRRSAGGNVLFFTDVSDGVLGSFYRGSDVLVLPSISRSEAFGIVQLEAMSFGKPVISTIPVVNVDGQTGLVVAPRDVAALVVAMRALSVQDVRRKFGGRARIVAKEHGLAKMVQRTEAVYDSLR